MKKFLGLICVWITIVVLSSTANAAVLPLANGAAQTWDFHISGVLTGVSYLTFNEDQTIVGYMIVTSRMNTNGQTVTVGAVDVLGEWGINGRGRVVGYLENDPSSSIRMDITHFEGVVSKNGTKFRFKGQTDFGKINFSGVPAVELTSLVDTPFSPDWVVTVSKTTIVNKEITDSQTFLEVLDAQEVGTNLYYTTGRTSDLCLTGYTVLSHKGKMAMLIGEQDLPDSGDCADATAEPNVTVAAGKMNLRSGVAKLRGTEEGTSNTRVNMILYLGE